MPKNLSPLVSFAFLLAILFFPLGVGTNRLVAQITVFDPGISKMGFLQSGQLGVIGEQVEWVVTVVNNGNAAANNVIVTDTLRPELRFLRVEGNVQSTVNDQTISVTIPLLNPDESVSFSLFTTVQPGHVPVINTACVTGINGEVCATGRTVGELPQTGETPHWRTPLLIISSILGLAGLGGVIYFIWRHFKSISGKIKASDERL